MAPYKPHTPHSAASTSALPSFTSATGGQPNRMKQQNHKPKYDKQLYQQDDPFMEDGHQEQQHQKQKKKKRKHDEASSSSPVVEVTSARPSTTVAARTKGHGTVADEEDQDEDDEADDEAPLMLQKKQKHGLTTSSRKHQTSNTTSSSMPKKLILRLPSQQKSSVNSAQAAAVRTASKPGRSATTDQHPYSTSVRPTQSGQHRGNGRTADFSPLRSLAVIQDGDDLSDLDLHHYYTSSGDDDSLDEDELLLDDDEDVEGEEEKFIISRQEKREAKRQRRKEQKQAQNRSPNGPAYFDESNQSIDDEEGGPDTVHASGTDMFKDSMLSDLARQGRDQGVEAQESDARSDRDGPVTWSGAEDEAIDNLDQLLGLTSSENTFLLRAGSNPPMSYDDANGIIPFEDFLAADDGSGSESSQDETSSNDEDDCSSSDADEEQSPFMHSSLGPAGSMSEGENEHLATTQAVIENGGFVFYNAGNDSSFSEDEEYDSASTLHEDGEPWRPASSVQPLDDPERCEDSGDTTDTLSDDDQLGLIRFGIESYDSDDQEMGKLLSASLRNQDIGLSVSINALADRPQQVVNKTARTLGVTKEIAAKILTSVGMSLLLQEEELKQSKQEKDRAKKERRERLKQKESMQSPQASTVSLHDGTIHQHSSTAHDAAPTNATRTQPLQADQAVVQANYAPVFGDFAPAGDADLCVVIGTSNHAPAPSPFSLRKRARRGRRMTDASPSAPRHHQLRDQSVVSSMSSHSVFSQQQSISASSEEQFPGNTQYDIVLDLGDFVDPDMLPLGTTLPGDSAEEETDANTTTMLAPPLRRVSGHSARRIGDTSRWNRVPIGAFRNLTNDDDEDFTSLATAILSGTRDPAYADNLTFIDGAGQDYKRGRRQGGRRSRLKQIPVSPVLFPVGSSLKALSAAKSRKERRKERREKKERKARPHNGRKEISVDGNPDQGLQLNFPGVRDGGQETARHSSTAAPTLPQPVVSASFTRPARPATSPPLLPAQQYLTVPDSFVSGPPTVNSPSLPSDGLRHFGSPLFGAIGTGGSVPTLSLG